MVVVMKPLDSLFTIRLTRDRDEARRIVAGLEARKGDYTPHTAYERNYWAGTPARIEVARNQVVVSALNALGMHLGALGDGRKTLLVVTEGLVGEPRRRGQEFLANIDSIVRSANRSNVSIYPVDPRPPRPWTHRPTIRAARTTTSARRCGDWRAIPTASGFHELTIWAPPFDGRQTKQTPTTC